MVLGEKRCQWTKDHDFFIFFEGNGSSKFFFFCLSMFQTLFGSYWAQIPKLKVLWQYWHRNTIDLEDNGLVVLKELSIPLKKKK